MQILMFDRQSIFIHGMKIGLQQYIPEIDILAPVRLNSSGRS